MDNRNKLVCYAAYSKNEHVRLVSSSGAIFSLVAEKILSMEGVVYGVTLSPDNKSAEFLRVNDFFGLDRLRGSKYVQAKIGDTYKQVKQDLDKGIPVLFTGVGCQINGLKAFLVKEYDHLFCVDVICHGVPSPALWRKYVEKIEQSSQAKLISVNFRCKIYGWRDFGIKRMDSKRKIYYLSKDDDPFMQMFLKNLCLRPSCYQCPARQNKKSDLTIGDFWGIEKVAPEINDNKGISLVIVRSEKGKRLFEAIKNGIICKSVSYEDGIKENPCDYESVKRPIQRDRFFTDMNFMDFTELKKKYLPVSIKQKVKKIVFKLPFYRILGGGVKRIT